MVTRGAGDARAEGGGADEEQVRIAKEIQKKLQKWMTVFYDDSGAVGRRYRRQDEVGTPFCVTVDFETLGEQGEELKDTVTIRHRDELDAITEEEKKCDRLVELNVQEQVMHLAKTSIIQRAWKQSQTPHLHVCVYVLKDGVIKPVFEMKAGTHIDPLYEYDDL